MRALKAGIVIALLVYIPCSLIWLVALGVKVNRIDREKSDLESLLYFEREAVSQLYIQQAKINEHLAVYDDIVFPIEDPWNPDSMIHMTQKFREECKNGVE